MNWYQIIILVAGILVFIYLIASLIIQIEAFKSRRNYFNPKFIPKFLLNNMMTFNELKVKDQDYIIQAKPEEVMLTLDNKTTSQGLYFKNNSSTLVILLHGYQSKKEELTFLAKHYHSNMNLDVLSIDHLGHGKSTGKKVNFGYYDKKIVKLWVAKMKEINPKYTIVLHGLSMGAHIALATAQDIPSEIHGVISDSPYYNLQELFYSLVPKILRPLAAPLILGVSVWNKLFQGFYLNDVKLDKLEQISGPVLIMHGGKDNFIRPFISEKAYHKLVCDKERVVVENSYHVCGFIQDNETYLNAVKRLMEKIGDNNV